MRLVDFPLPNDALIEAKPSKDWSTVVASAYANDCDDEALVVLLNRTAPLYTVAHIVFDGIYWNREVGARDHNSIIDAVADFADRGGGN